MNETEILREVGSSRAEPRGIPEIQFIFRDAISGAVHGLKVALVTARVNSSKTKHGNLQTIGSIAENLAGNKDSKKEPNRLNS